MNESIYFNPKYHIARPNSNHNGLFSSFNIFKSTSSKVVSNSERTPYPIIIQYPNFKEVMSNMNKSDVLVYFATMTLGFGVSLKINGGYKKLNDKLIGNRIYMSTFNVLGLWIAYSCSFQRLRGFLDNGLRWKNPDSKYLKYDFTSDFENNTKFKYFRIRT